MFLFVDSACLNAFLLLVLKCLFSSDDWLNTSTKFYFLVLKYFTVVLVKCCRSWSFCKVKHHPLSFEAFGWTLLCTPLLLSAATPSTKTSESVQLANIYAIPPGFINEVECRVCGCVSVRLMRSSTASCQDISCFHRTWFTELLFSSSPQSCLIPPTSYLANQSHDTTLGDARVIRASTMPRLWALSNVHFEIHFFKNQMTEYWVAQHCREGC